MASELCMNCFSVKGNFEVCPYCGYAEGTPPAQPHYLTPGSMLGNHFIVGTVIGVGGFGITYKCFDITLGVAVAIKEFYPAGLVNRSPGERRVGLLSGDKQEQYRQRLKRFLTEAKSMAQFGKAKDIVNVYDYFEENATAYIVMEYIDGILLKTYLEKQGRMEPEVALNTIMPIIEAVKKIHSKGIIHRDVSPDNIFIINEDSIKIFDFGAARLNDTKEGMDAEPVIKVGYSPLEQYRNKNSQGFYTDVYAVGAILYQMLTGRVPVESTEREFEDRLKSPMETGVKISANLDRAVMEALAVRQELRFQNISEFEEALQNKRIAEYPKDKLRKKKNKRNAMIGLTAVLAAGVAVAMGLYGSVLKPRNQIFDSEINKALTVRVWVETKAQKAQIEAFLPGGFQKGKKEAEDERLRRMQEENENVKVKIEVVSNMEKALKKAKKEKKLPHMFVSDHVSDLEQYDLVSLEDNYNLIDSKDYVFMSDYEDSFPGMKEMPTGVDPLLVYVGKFDYHKSNGLADSEVKTKTAGSDIETVELSSLFPKGDEMQQGEILSTKFANVQPDVLGETLLLENEEWADVFAGKNNPTKTMLRTLSNVQTFCEKAKAPKFKWNSEVDKDGIIVNNGGKKYTIYGSNILAGISFRAKVSKALENKEKTANPINSCEAYVVTEDDRMLVKYAERYAILNEGSKQHRIACMRLLWCMLTENGQSKKAESGSLSYPILRSSFEKFSDYNAGYGDFVELERLRQPCVLLGAKSRQADAYADGVGKEKDVKKLQKYSKEYVKEAGTLKQKQEE